MERWVHADVAAENGSLFLPLRFSDRSLFFEKVIFDIESLLHFHLQFKDWLQKNSWICTKVYQSEGKTENLVCYMGCKFSLSVVLLSGGSKNFQPHIRTKIFLNLTILTIQMS